MSDKIELIRLCRVLQRNFLCLSQSDSRTQPCHVRILFLSYVYLLTSLQPEQNCNLLQPIYYYYYYI